MNLFKVHKMYCVELSFTIVLRGNFDCYCDSISKEIPHERNLATKPQDYQLCSIVALSNCASSSFFECSIIVITVLNGKKK